MNKLFAVTKKAFQSTFADFIGKMAPDFADRLIPFSYEQIIAGGRFPRGNYLFTDMDRATRQEIVRSAQLCQALVEDGGTWRVINWPNRVLNRYELLRRLCDNGTNRFNVYLYAEARRPGRYPVFVRLLSIHGGESSALLQRWDDVEATIEQLLKQGACREDILITEFEDTRSPDDLYRKYSYFVFDGAVYPGPVMFSKTWNVNPLTMFCSDATIDEEIAFSKSAPHLDRIKEIFAFAHIQYGRIDYALLNGAVRIWEINTNPGYWGVAPTKYPARQERFVKPFLLPIWREGFSRLLEPGGGKET